MLDKIAYVPEVDEYGFTRVVSFGARGDGLEKVASLPDGVQKYIDRHFTPKDGKLGLLVTALGAGEYWGSNSNADIFDEKSLNHVPSGWSDDPTLDKPLAQGWPYGYPTFYKAHSFSHHANKSPEKSIGSIEYVTWDPDMHWVLAVMEIDEQKAKKHNGTWILERAAAGKSISVSMGCFPEGIPVTLASGQTTPIESLKVGDSVLNARGQETRVTETHVRDYAGRLYKIKPYGEQEIEATEEHPFLVFRQGAVRKPRQAGRPLTTFKSDEDISKARAEWVRAKNLQKGDFLIKPAGRMVATHDYATSALARFADVQSAGPDKRYRRLLLPNGWTLLPIVSVEEAPLYHTGKVYNIEVQEGASYVAGNVAVHNCRVPFDVASTSPDVDRYMKAWGQYDPKRHKSPADAILEAHALKRIRGLSKTRKEYPDDLLFHANEVLSSGVKIYAINDFPSFFDLSGVGVPADQVAWSIRKLGNKMPRCKIAGAKCTGGCTGDCTKLTAPSVVLWEECMAKNAEVRTASLGKGADIDKTVPALDAKIEKPNPTDIPKDLLDRLGKDHDLGSVLATPSLMGMPLRPREFRRIMMIRIGKKDLADKLDEKDIPMPRSLDEECPFSMGSGMFDDSIARMLLPLLGRRSALGPVVKRINITVIKVSPDSEPKGDEPELQKKISSLYNGYRRLVMDKIGEAKEVMAARPWLRGALYGLDSLDKVGAMTVPLVPLVVDETLTHLRDW